ncbi:APC membrane recruitment protein 1 [Bombina bombina]|uniref:APC membrane recruitment protein 1 n=1 Tax=Bombina bombina TaxID=8345 RepID=UPI00235A9816|nr:APC membrane recruitment protein 1 [Bombina bombina]XP_053555194.1 APC membrane recruitment protein 1 [Bombina bombina]XP_053555195.1 APC membrane recruitment protein 1 [Bombina bombina]
METLHSCSEENIRPKSSSSVCEQNDNAQDSAKVEISPGQNRPGVDHQNHGKQKKTPFKFFGGRKSICTLPSFFGGKHKGLGKGSSWKGLSKSKTHDGISDVPCEDGKKGCSESSINKLSCQELTRVGHTLPSSHSADLSVSSTVKLDFNFHDTSPLGSTECFDKKVNGEKSLSFPRPKKGLKGLFSSIRRHKKKNPDTEKSVHYDHTTPFVIIEPESKKYHKKPELEESIELPNLRLSPNSSLNKTVESEKETLECSVSFSEVTKHTVSDLPVEANIDVANVEHALDTKPSSAVLCSSPIENFPEVANVDAIALPSISAGDQISLIFDEVSSLKSFDSFTGCGDIIADQDIDTVSDSAVSLERSRETTKRSSCLVTYQGGGEEMATPDDMEEEYLQHLLEESSETDASYTLDKNHDLKEFTELENTGYTLEVENTYNERVVTNNTEVLSPQSDQQESAPNSDEGYYDSTTPGNEDDTGDGFSQKERLPRDSYSGDALYEFYEPDDSLMSPAPGGESMYESKTPCSEIFEQLFDFSLPAGNNLIQDIECKNSAMETEEERLAVIQKQLLFWEKQREATLKGIEDLNKDLFSKDTQNVECNAKTKLMGKDKVYLSSKKIPQNTSKEFLNKGIPNSRFEKLSWKDFQENSLANSSYQESYIQHLVGNGLIRGMDFELNVDRLRAQNQSDTNEANLMYPNTTAMLQSQNVFVADNASISAYDQESEFDQAVNFSQTLVDFTSNDMLFSRISERLGKADGSSSFQHKLDALPTMVTFDIVDVENEGECDQQIELSVGDDVVESFENFDHSCVQESLADCEQLFQLDSTQTFHSYNWGVTSLPRHFGHYKLNPPMPAPLSLNRRSKSLDAESLELERDGLQLSKNVLKSYDFIAPWGGEKTSWNYEATCPLDHEVGWDGCDALQQRDQTSEEFLGYSPVITSNQAYNRKPQDLITNKQIARTLTSPLECNSRQPSPYQYNRKNTSKKLALVLPLEERKVLDVNRSTCVSHIHDKQVKAKPVGITQAMPQHQKNEEETLKLPTCYQEQSVDSTKGTVEHRDSASENWSKNYGECTTSS